MSELRPSLSRKDEIDAYAYALLLLIDQKFMAKEDDEKNPQPITLHKNTSTGKTVFTACKMAGYILTQSSKDKDEPNYTQIRGIVFAGEDNISDEVIDTCIGHAKRIIESFGISQKPTS